MTGPELSGRIGAVSTHPATRRYEWTARLIAAGVLELIGVGATAAAAHNEPAPFRPLDALGYALLVIASGAVAAPRRWRPVAFLVALAATAAYQGLAYPTHAPYFVGVLACAYAAGSAGDRRRSALLAALILPAYGVLALRAAPADLPGDLLFPVGIALALAIGQVVGEQRAAVERSLSEARAAEARRQLTEERLRIARELHDVISHSIAMINVQAGVAAHVMAERPEQTREALLAIKGASRDALRDLRGILGLLREPDQTGPRAPRAGLAQLPALVQSVRDAGLCVELAGGVDGPSLPAAIDLAAYRVVQEALTNVLRHAPASSARVTVDRRPGVLSVAVEDDGRSPAAVAGEARRGPGHGLIGLRERVCAAGGTVDAGPRPEGGFLVQATFPLEAEER